MLVNRNFERKPKKSAALANDIYEFDNEHMYPETMLKQEQPMFKKEEP